MKKILLLLLQSRSLLRLQYLHLPTVKMPQFSAPN